MSDKIGTLYIVATPIGNLQDMTLRAIEVLKKVDKIAVEDTRHTAPLLKHFSITKATISLHEFNERERTSLLIDYLHAGESIALISDAGTPLISDPGYHLVHHARVHGISVVPIPGACAAITALSVSGMPTDKFIFEGFLPAKTAAKRNHLISLLHETRTMIFYEAPHRLLDTLIVMKEIFGAKKLASVARELTKVYESVISTSLEELLAHYQNHEDQLRGEIVILVHGSDEAKSVTKEVVPSEVLTTLLQALPLKQAVQLASDITGERKNILYDLALQQKN